MSAALGPARFASCSGRTFEGPQPKRPSAGRRASGMAIVALVGMGVLSEEIGCGAQACGLVRLHRSLVVDPPERQSRRLAECSERIGATPLARRRPAPPSRPA